MEIIGYILFILFALLLWHESRLRKVESGMDQLQKQVVTINIKLDTLIKLVGELKKAG